MTFAIHSSDGRGFGAGPGDAELIHGEVDGAYVHRLAVRVRDVLVTDLGFNEYLRLPQSDVWHWHSRCHHYLNIRTSGTYQMSATKSRPSTGRLCNECQAKTRRAG